MQTPDRGKQRMERLRQLELEQLQWDQDALVMPEDLDRALALSFASVKTEFSDLDGLAWPRYPVPLVTNPWALDEPTTNEPVPDSCDVRTPVHSPTLPHRSPQRRSQRSPASRRDFASDTIRVSRLAQASRSPLQPANHPQYSPSSNNDLLASPYSHPPLTCHTLRYPAYGRG